MARIRRPVVWLQERRLVGPEVRLRDEGVNRLPAVPVIAGLRNSSSWPIPCPCRSDYHSPTTGGMVSIQLDSKHAPEAKHELIYRLWPPETAQVKPR
jgi:hypothetical protein